MAQHEVIFRVDAGEVEGLGHLQRCLALASYLVSQGCSLCFICRTRRITTDERLKNYEVYYLDELKSINVSDNNEVWDARMTLFAIEEKSKSPTVIVVDHYDLGVVWEHTLWEAGYCIVVVDDFRTRHHCADLITSDSLAPFDLSLNSGLTDSIVLNGPAYALLSPDYAAVKVRKNKKVNRILVTYGATDPTGETLIAIKAIGQLRSRGQISENVIVDVVIGPLNAFAVSLLQTAKVYRQMTHFNPHNLASLMPAADLVVTAGGNAMTEALALLKPCVVTVTAENQQRLVSQLSTMGLVNFIGEGGAVSISALAKAIDETAQSVEKWATRIAEARPFDCLGAERVGQAILALSRRSPNMQRPRGVS